MRVMNMAARPRLTRGRVHARDLPPQPVSSAGFTGVLSRRASTATPATTFHALPGRSLSLRDHLVLACKRLALVPARFVNANFLYVSRLNMACARGALSAATRTVDPKKTWTWEFSAFSQNGEDGLIDQLLSTITSPNRYFIEIGASDGLENNSSYLAFVKKYDGIMVEGDPFKAQNAARFLQSLNWGVKYLNLFMTPETAGALVDDAHRLDPDFFSLDIDGTDYYVAQSCLRAGFRPKVLCVEYNSTFGPHQSVTIPYCASFDYRRAHSTGFYYGVSLRGWKTLLSDYDYQFVTVDRRGVNAFFVDPSAVDGTFFHGLQVVDFAENCAHALRHPGGWEGQFAEISSLPYVTIG
jgi:hypothetical protein